MTENPEFDFFGDGMRIYLDYIQRQTAKNPDYLPHTLIRAFWCAFEGIKEGKIGQRFMGVSQDGTPTNVCNPYIVVVEKVDTGVELKEVRNIKIDKEVPIPVMIIIFRMQILLDRISGDTVSPAQMVEVLNAVIPGDKFYALGDRWKEARDDFRKLAKEGKIVLPKEDPELMKELLKITLDTPWEDYSPTLRSFIGSGIMRGTEQMMGRIVITSPTNSKIEKFKVFDLATEFLLGKTSEYLFDKKDGNQSEIQ
jgi:hypothetical protein